MAAPPLLHSVMWAARTGDVAALENWFSTAEPKDIEATVQGSTLLQHAVAKNQLPAMRFLLARGLSPDRADAHDRCPLHRAAASGRLDALLLLLANGAAVDARDARDATPLMLAASTAFARRDEILVALLRRGASLYAADDEGKTAEQRARRRGHARAAALLSAARGWSHAPPGG